MKRFGRLILGCALAPVILVMCAGDALAYLDLGTGSYILQVLIGCLLGAAFAVKVFWRTLVAHASNLVSRVWKRHDAGK